MTSPSSAASPAGVVLQFMKAMEPLDYDRALTLVTADVHYENMPAGFGAVRGPEGIRAVLEPFFKPTLENEFRVLRQATAGNTVFLERLDRHRLATGWVELPVTGVFEVTGGKISFWRDYFDAPTILSKWPQS